MTQPSVDDAYKNATMALQQLGSSICKELKLKNDTIEALSSEVRMSKEKVQFHVSEILKSLETEVIELNEAKTYLENQLAESNTWINTLEYNFNNLQEEHVKDKELVHKLEGTLHLRDKLIDSLEEKLKKLKNEKTNLEDVLERKNALLKTNLDLKDDCKSLEENLKKLKNEKSKLEDVLHKKNLSLKTAKNDLESLKITNDKLEKDLLETQHDLVMSKLNALSVQDMITCQKELAVSFISKLEADLKSYKEDKEQGDLQSRLISKWQEELQSYKKEVENKVETEENWWSTQVKSANSKKI